MKFLSDCKLLFVSFFVCLYAFRVQLLLLLGLLAILCFGLIGLDRMARGNLISTQIERGYRIVSTSPCKGDPTKTIFTLVKGDKVVYCEGYKIPNTDRISNSICSFSEPTDSYNLGTR